MKKLLALLLIIILCFSLCACVDAKETSTTNTEDATNFEYRQFLTDIEENEVRAQDTYEGYNFFISGFVDEINSDKCTLIKYSETMGTECTIEVPLTKDEIKKLNRHERINIVGTVDKIYRYSIPHIKLVSASVVDNKTSVSGTIQSIVYNSVNDNLPNYCTISIDGYFDNSILTYCDVYLDGNILNKFSEGDSISVEGNMFAYGDFDVHMHNNSKILGELLNAELVS